MLLPSLKALLRRIDQKYGNIESDLNLNCYEREA